MGHRRWTFGLFAHPRSAVVHSNNAGITTMLRIPRLDRSGPDVRDRRPPGVRAERSIAERAVWASSKRVQRDAEVTGLIAAARQRPFHARFGAGKMWLHLRRQGHEVARCTVERLMARNGWHGALRGKRVRTTISDDAHDRPGDLVDRDFTATAPNKLWVVDFT